MSVRLVSASPQETVQAAVARMAAENVGAVAVCEGPRLVGIFSERDVLRLAGAGADLAALRVGEVMSAPVVSVSPWDDLLAVARLMGARRIRHLPVVEGENLLGMLGIREVLHALVERLWQEHDPGARETAHELLQRWGVPPPREAEGP
jgi:CBS domain-containing protein